MKTTKEQRAKHALAMLQVDGKNEAKQFVLDLLDDCAWQAEMLERATETFNTESKCGNPEATQWLADLEKGP